MQEDLKRQLFGTSVVTRLTHFLFHQSDGVF
jgi:hypothetical protein